jgi:MYXO-CTERM domain-containing protein
MLPCQEAADCGEGFECKAEEICQCSGGGSAGVPPSDGAGGAPEPEPVPPQEPSCSCVPGDSNYCAIIEQVCATDAECPAGWTCSANPESVACSRPDGSTGTGAECGSTEPDMVCLPPFARTVIAVSGGEPLYAGEEDSGSQAGIPEGAPTSDPTVGGPNPGGPNTGSPNTGSEEADSGESGSCSVAGPHSSSTAWLSLFGVAALLLGRRKRSAS